MARAGSKLVFRAQPNTKGSREAGVTRESIWLIIRRGTVLFIWSQYIIYNQVTVCSMEMMVKRSKCTVSEDSTILQEQFSNYLRH